MYKNGINPIQQVMLIISTYNNIIVNKRVKCNNYELILRIKPSEISKEYLVKFKIVNNEKPKIYVLKPNLYIENNGKQPPHMYSLEKGQICLFLPNEISTVDKYVKIIPWISEWLLHYEIWRCTGRWHGHGHEFNKKE